MMEPPTAVNDSEQWWRWGIPKTYNPAVDPPPSGSCDSNDVMTNGAANCPLLTASNFGISGGAMTVTGYYKLPDPPFASIQPLYAGVAVKSGDPTKLWWTTGYFLAELNIPTIVNNPSPATWSTASFVQTSPGPGYVQVNDGDPFTSGLFCDEVECQDTTNGFVSSVLDIGTHVILGGFNYFDNRGSGAIDKALFRVSRTLASFSYPGAVRGWDGDGVVNITQSFVSQFCGHTPTEWQTALGNIHYCGGSSSIPIVSRTTNGPSIVMLDLGQVNTTTVTGQGLLYYLGSGPTATLGQYDDTDVTSEVWDSTAILAGCQMINGTRTMVCLYMHGTGTAYGRCYGTTPVPTGDCGITIDDPEYQGIGYHAPPYVWRYMLYDLNKLKAVRDGTGGWTHENVAPYESGEFTITANVFQHRMLGLAYDATNHRLHTLLRRAWGGTDRDFPAGMVIPVTIP
jgi:hypothetical protein